MLLRFSPCSSQQAAGSARKPFRPRQRALLGNHWQPEQGRHGLKQTLAWAPTCTRKQCSLPRYAPMKATTRSCWQVCSTATSVRKACSTKRGQRTALHQQACCVGSITPAAHAEQLLGITQHPCTPASRRCGTARCMVPWQACHLVLSSARTCRTLVSKPPFHCRIRHAVWGASAQAFHAQQPWRRADGRRCCHAKWSAHLQHLACQAALTLQNQACSV